VVGRDPVNNYKVTQKMLKRIQAIPGVVDARIHEQIAYPTLNVDVDRDKAQQFGLTQRDVASSMLISLSGSYQTAPNQWLNLQNGVNYSVTVQTPQYKIDSIDAMQRTPVTSASRNGNTQLLSSMATVHRGVSTAIVDHYNVQPVYDIFCDADLRDLGSVARDIQKVIDRESKDLPKGSWSVMRGQVTTMQDSFFRLGIGIAFAVIFVYLLMVVNFQSWLDPFIILMALPLGFSGILWMLYITRTTFNVPSLMGIIMAIGVATANSILVVTFANDERATGKGPFEAALSAGYTRLRPVCMTALAMIIGMLPMSLALGEGGEQNAPLGRAVIGGLLFATFGTLFIVPIFYTIFRKTPPVDYDKEIQLEYEEELPEEGAQPA
jgi:multidrug efflux pump subunit AcrB